LPTDVAVGLSAVASNVLTGRPERINQRTPRIISGGLLQLELDKPANRQLQAAPAGTDGADAKCDGAFLKCILSETCRGCFATMQENDVDWANVVPDTPCQDVLGFLVASGHCTDVRHGGVEEQDIFCTAFDSCVVWDDDEDSSTTSAAKKQGETADKAGDSIDIDCTTLTECKWDGMHEHFLSDGVCHDSLPGCYNSKACNYDGGDCCQDTCEYPGGSVYGECGQDGYACRDPSSTYCQPSLARASKEFCSHEDEEKDGENPNFDDDEFKKSDAVVPQCPPGQSVYRLLQFDSWGDGWDKTLMTIKEKGAQETVYSGGLQFGAQGTVYLCLSSKEPKCYAVKVENGVWGNEISWEIRPENSGAPVLAAGGFPTDCTVPLGGAVADCENTCDSKRPDTEIGDPNYKSYKDMEACIEKKCLIQVGNCARDDSCSECMQESSPDYCFANDNFDVLIDCTMCSCTEERPAYCDAKTTGSAAATGSNAASHEGNMKVKPAEPISGSITGGTRICGPEQTLSGTGALVKYAECAHVDQMMAMVTEFDNDNFGMLDVFEDCAHTYNHEPAHGGKKALDCMNILHSLIIDDDLEGGGVAPHSTNAKGEKLPQNIARAVSGLAQSLYHDAESFCDCTSSVNSLTPLCSSFTNFKTLLYESVDACKSLDQIDCAAWEEFYTPCKENLIAKFASIDFENVNQCEYVQASCGGVGAFPAFRRMDCGKEIAKAAWDFHIGYSRGCLKSSSESTPSSPSSSIPVNPSPTPKYVPMPQSKEKKAYTPYQPRDKGADEKKPYYSPSYSSPDSSSTEESTTKAKKTRHHYVINSFLVLVLAGVGLFVYRKRRENFNYARFRQLREARNYAGGSNFGNTEYTGVSMSESCSFEPPTLPPTPSANMI